MVFVKCARTVCERKGQLKHIQNHQLYCVSCARKIREANPETPDLVEWPNLKMYSELVDIVNSKPQTEEQILRKKEILRAFNKENVSEVFALKDSLK